MQKFKSNFVYLVLLSAFIITGCSKKNDPKPIEWIYGQWFWESYNAPGIRLDSCITQNNYIFNEDYTASLSLFASSGDDTCQQVDYITGKFELRDRGKTFVFIDKDGEESSAEIFSQTETKMVIGDENTKLTLVKSL